VSREKWNEWQTTKKVILPILVTGIMGFFKQINIVVRLISIKLNNILSLFTQIIVKRLHQIARIKQMS
jgi:hypothetical protein